ncbi:MAG TPA: hypothetical protein PLP61_13460 [Nocardioides sp.]|uniref:hypothetical protein n=1 Tax=Nocardioides sp. TaxID=35761 RepID=UPI002C601581|nr:hypothetical protein [Nocardioides sp.]HQR28041.1 hypothetical protein [Nocardioides sp.]
MTGTATLAPDRLSTSGRTPRRTLRVVLVLPAGVALLAGLDAALLLLDLPAPLSTARLPEVHGVLLVLGFVGTLVSLERAVALGRPLGFAAPALLGLAGMLLVSPAPLVLARSVLVAGTAALVLLYLPLWCRQRDEAVLVQALGAVLALGAAVLWLGSVPVPTLLPWLVGFVVLTVGGERLELARLAMGPDAGTRLVALALAFVAGVLLALLRPGAGYPLLGAALLALVAWLVVHDVARRTVTTTGLPRYMAGCMLAGYGWLLVAAGAWLVAGRAADGAAYDLVVHAVFLGFTLSMVLAHAPVILPAVLGRPLPYTPALVVPAVLLHASLALRLWVGDGLGHEVAWRIGGLLNVVALLAFVAVVLWSVLRRGRSS